MPDFRCYFLDAKRAVMAVEDMKAPTLNRAVTKGILAMVIRQAENFELWRRDLCVYVHKPEAEGKPSAKPAARRHPGRP